MNKVSVEVLEASPEKVEGIFDVVVANLEIRIFRKVFKDIVPKIGEVGIFSGIYRFDELLEFLHMLKEVNLKPTKVLEKNNWYAVRVVKDGVEG